MTKGKMVGALVAERIDELLAQGHDPMMIRLAAVAEAANLFAEADETLERFLGFAEIAFRQFQTSYKLHSAICIQPKRQPS